MVDTLGILLETGKLIRIEGESGWSLVQINPGGKRAEIRCLDLEDDLDSNRTMTCNILSSQTGVA